MKAKGLGLGLGLKGRMLFCLCEALGLIPSSEENSRQMPKR